MNPNDPMFKNKFMMALNLKIKKHIPKTADFNPTALENKIQAIALTVLMDMGVKNWGVWIAMKPCPGGKYEMGCRFSKIKAKREDKLWTPSSTDESQKNS